MGILPCRRSRRRWASGSRGRASRRARARAGAPCVPHCLVRRVRQQQHRLVHVAHVAGREHRLILLDEGYDVRSGDVAVVRYDELGPIDVLAEPDRGDAAARRWAAHRHAPQEALERQIVHVPLAAGELGESVATLHGGILSPCCTPGQGVTLRTLITTLVCTVNGVRHERTVEPRLLLSDFLRHELGLTGTHVGCEHGVCGACTVLLDGEAVRSCLMFAVQADGHDVATVEGLAPPGGGDELHPLQAAFREAHGLQCGFCPPGFLLTLVPFLREPPHPSEPATPQAPSGHLRRRTGYQGLVAAARLDAASAAW